MLRRRIFLALALLGSVLVPAVLATPAAAAGPNDPTGAVTDAVRIAPTVIRVTGWVQDPNGATYVHLLLDGWDRPIVADAIASNGRWTWDLTTDTQVHSVCAVGVNVGAGTGDVRLDPGCVTVPVFGNPPPNPTTSHDPTGRITGATRIAPTVIRVDGSVSDPDGGTYVHLLLDGWDRPIVADAIAANGQWTRDITVDTDAHAVCVVGVNLGTGTGDVRLGCVAVGPYVEPEPSHDPRGTIDSAIRLGPTVARVSGQVTDPDGGTYVHLLLDGWDRPVAADAIATGGRWTRDLAIDGAAHQVCAVAVNVGRGAGDVRLGCLGVPSAAAAPPALGRPPATAKSISYNPFAAKYANQCTYYAEMRMQQQTGKFMPVYGNAYQWAAQAEAAGWTVGPAPLPKSVVVFPAGAFMSPNGHVGWVVDVRGSTIHIQDYNWGWVGAEVTDHWVSIVPGTKFIYSDR